jgi:1A family penicillin-binding protein
MTLHYRFLGSVRRAAQGRSRILAAAIIALACFLLVGSTAIVWAAYEITADLPQKNDIRDLADMAQATTIYDDDDQAVFTIFREQRIEVPLEKISPNLIKAVLSVEDQRFYEHGGIDFIRIAAAAVRNVELGRRAEGGSTITQQLARQSLLTRDKTFRRKVKEAILAAHIEHEYSKNDILEMYLNKVYLGSGFYGVEAASRGYFGKSASELTVPEAALLAGLIQSPSSYAPTANLDRAIARRNVVLQTMVSSGAITGQQYEQSKKAAVHLTNGLEVNEKFGLYFKEQVQKELVDRFGWTRVLEGGLRVYTTIDPSMQQTAEKIVEDGLQSIEHRRGYKHPLRAAFEEGVRKAGLSDKDTKGDRDTAPDYLQGALVAMDPTDGSVRAMVGGRDFEESRFNRATQAKRQAGSAYKPFVYAAALEAGYSPASLITNLNNPTLTQEGGWVPEDEHSSATQMTMRAALRMSSNRAAVQMLNTIGIPKAVSYAQRLNIGTPPSVPSLALGASDVTLLSLTAAYGAFADKGIVHTPVLIRRVEDNDGKVLFQNPNKAQQAVSESTAFLMSSMLADVVNAGTAYKARQSGFTLPAAGKTGTTNDYVDAWFVGYTPHLVTGVWVGFDQPQTIVANGYGGDLSVPIWASFMKTATKGDKPDWIDRPSNVVGVNVCRLSGMLPNEGCDHVDVVNDDGTIETKSMIYTDYFVRGTQPTTLCPLHPGRSMFATMAGAFGIQVGKPAPVPADAAAVPPAAAGTSGASPAPNGQSSTKVEEPKKKKRGFWSRLFGGGGDDDKSSDEKKPDDKDKKNPKKPGGGGQSPRDRL